MKSDSQPTLSRLGLTLDLSADSSSTDLFYPAGSLSSHRDSRLESEDASQPAPRGEHGPRGPSEDYFNFKPTRENVIVFEVCSPISLEKGPEMRTSMGHSDSETIICELRALVDHQRMEIASLKANKGAASLDKATMTTQMEEFQIVPALKREIEHLTNACKRYERQNQELRAEIQHCSSDLVDLDHSKARISKELKKYQSKSDSLEAEFRKIAELVDTVLNRTEEPGLGETDMRHLSNYVSSKVEIIGSKYSRLLTAYDRAIEENAKLREDLEGNGEEMAKQLHSKIALKDKFIEKLEKTLVLYKEKMMDLKGEEDSEQFEDLMSKNRTENLSHKLREIAEDLPPFRSQHGSPQRPVHFSPEPSFSFLDASPVPAELQTEIKPETPVKEKRLAWKSKQTRRHAFIGTNFQSQLAVEKYRPVLSREKSGSRGKPVRTDSQTPKFCRQQESKAVSAERKKRDSKSARPSHIPAPK